MRANYQALYKDYGGNEVTDIFDYGIGSLWQSGTDGAGTTVAIVTAWDDPKVDSDGAAFDKGFHLPDPQIETIYPAGALPSKCPPQMNSSTGTRASWADEETIDVDAIHLIAPYAKMLVAVAPPDTQEADDPASNSAPPEFMKALETISSQHLASVISINGGTGESTYGDGAAEICAQDAGELEAAAAGIPVLVATGDSGVVQALPTAQGGTDTTTTPDVATWSDSPWVTAVGGSVPHMSSTAPTKLGPDPLWSHEGGGYSSVYARPSYQNGVSGAPTRSVPDITMDAQMGCWPPRRTRETSGRSTRLFTRCSARLGLAMVSPTWSAATTRRRWYLRAEPRRSPCPDSRQVAGPMSPAAGAPSTLRASSPRSSRRAGPPPRKPRRVARRNLSSATSGSTASR